MTYITASIAKTRIFARLEQALNAASMGELEGYLAALGDGATLVDLLEAQWRTGHPQSLSRADQVHVVSHAFPRKGNGWWGPDALAIATEGLAQALLRMIAASDGHSRKWARRIECLWVAAGTHHFHVSITDSPQQITLAFMTPPKGDQVAEYALYQQVRKLADAQLPGPRDKRRIVPKNLTRLENIWTVGETRWVAVSGVGENGKPLPVAEVQRNLTKGKGVVVTRQLCEAFEDRSSTRNKLKARKKG